MISQIALVLVSLVSFNLCVISVIHAKKGLSQKKMDRVNGELLKAMKAGDEIIVTGTNMKALF